MAARPGLGVTAQEATPVAMTAEETRTTMDAYFDALLGDGDFGQYLAEDVTLAVMDTGQVVEGREAVIGTIVALHQQIFETAAIGPLHWGAITALALAAFVIFEAAERLQRANP